MLRSIPRFGFEVIDLKALLPPPPREAAAGGNSTGWQQRVRLRLQGEPHPTDWRAALVLTRNDGERGRRCAAWTCMQIAAPYFCVPLLYWSDLVCVDSFYPSGVCSSGSPHHLAPCLQVQTWSRGVDRRWRVARILGGWTCSLSWACMYLVSQLRAVDMLMWSCV